MEFHAQKAIFLQISDLLTEGILEKRWGTHERIPSVRELASSIEVNPNTVNRSFAYLQELGIIENKRGIGYFVTTDAVEKIISIKRKEFIELEIPRIAKTVKLLNLSVKELQLLLQQKGE